MRLSTPLVLLLATCAANLATPAPAWGQKNDKGSKDDKNRPPEDETLPDEDGKNDDEEDVKECVTHKTQARFIAGYDHLVHIRNACSKPVTCQVSTNVNPKPQTVKVEAKGKETVLTYRGSPAREFSATVECEFIGKKK